MQYSESSSRIRYEGNNFGSLGSDKQSSYEAVYIALYIRYAIPALLIFDPSTQRFVLKSPI